MSRLEFVTRLRPVWADSMLVRRAAAMGLCLLAIVAVMRGDPADQPDAALIATRDLPPGHVLSDGDLRVVRRAADTLPTGVVRDAGKVLGATLTGALGSGEVITELRIVGPRLAAVAAGSPDARIVPIRLADNAIAEILRSGDRVDVVAAADSGSEGRPARLLATDAAVVLISGAKSERGQGERVVLVALDARRAAVVAAASLHTALTVVFH